VAVSTHSPSFGLALERALEEPTKSLETPERKPETKTAQRGIQAALRRKGETVNHR
jgi:hypothetical protein